MKIINLVENTRGVACCEYAHGLSFYIETKKHKLLMDLGPSEVALRNAEQLGIDLKAVDTVILSHGHYDHSGGLMAFAKLNPTAVIYMQKEAGGPHFSDDGPDKGDQRFRYIGIDPDLLTLPQVKLLDGDYVIDDELSLFTVENRMHRLPFANGRILVRSGEGFVRDDFRHEQYLVIREGKRNYLMSGCAHNGMLNILDEYKKKYGGEPDAAISGFHMMKKTDYTEDELSEIIYTAKKLTDYRTRFVTCHCTGIPAYKGMKVVMGDQLQYVHSGQEIRLLAEDENENEIENGNEKSGKNRKNRPEKNGGRKGFMKMHKFFAWATVACFILTIITGYKKK